MFSEKEIEIMTLPYFNVLSTDPAMYQVQSKNTGHCWAIIQLDTKKHNYHYMLLHKHSLQGVYHYHNTVFTSVLDVILEVVAHDDYKTRRKSGMFEELVQKYG